MVLVVLVVAGIADGRGAGWMGRWSVGVDIP